MNRRDTFAVVAMHAILSRVNFDSINPPGMDNARQRYVASLAYDIAAEMINEREGRPDPEDPGPDVTALEEGFRDLGIDIENLGETLRREKQS